MRLLNTNTLELEEFVDSEIPLYAILSHTWEKEEVTYRHLYDDLYYGKKDYLAYAGWKKVTAFCEKVRELDYEYAWVDSCCINKDSSAELSEAINSMFHWYHVSSLCFVYLADVDGELEEPSEDSLHSFGQSRWFKRGWTLQELLAPESMTFFDRGWRKLGTRSDLERHISSATGIDTRFINSFTSSWAAPASVAQKMFWASSRQTTKEEDIAYCLLGIFDVNMPLLYGEGEIKAFRRLQEEIMRTTNDESLFAWEDPNQLMSGLLADHPFYFWECRDVERTPLPGGDRAPYVLTNRGLQIEVQARGVHMESIRTEIRHLVRTNWFKAISTGLACGRYRKGTIEYIGISLMQVHDKDRTYVRVGGLNNCQERFGSGRKLIFVLQSHADIRGAESEFRDTHIQAESLQQRIDRVPSDDLDARSDVAIAGKVQEFYIEN